jgi:hypothetical protein
VKKAGNHPIFYRKMNENEKRILTNGTISAFIILKNRNFLAFVTICIQMI